MKKFEKSRPIEIVTYNPQWEFHFAEVAQDLSEVLGKLALRIDHIGSTSVEGLSAKDIVDVQITVANLQSPAIQEALIAAGYKIRSGILLDSFEGMDDDSPELKKRFSKGKEGQRNINIHIRELGRFNQRYPILFRDFLRSSEMARNTYGKLKVRLAEVFPDSIDGYLYIKDPMMDIIYCAAETWAKSTKWEL